jgi:peptide/nickel transport system permease protein
MQQLSRRLLVSVFVIFGTVTLVFFLLHWLPGDAVTILLVEAGATPDMIANLRHQFGLDRPVAVQYFDYLSSTIRGDFGTSLVSGEPVFSKLMGQFPATIGLTISGSLIAVILGTTAGILSAMRANRFTDYVIRIISLFGVSMPTFWTSLMLILIFSVKLQWFPAIGNGSLSQLVLPACTLGWVGAGLLTRMVRNDVLENMNEPYVTALRAKGLSEKTIFFRHILRNALISSITLIGIIVGELLAGTVVTETVFARQGIGKLMVDAIIAKDIPVVQGAILLISVLFITINILVDLAYGWIDPRIRESR